MKKRFFSSREASAGNAPLPGESPWETFCRRLSWVFSRSGMMALAFEHFLAMVPATILVPILVNNTIGENVIDMSLVLFSSGIGTLLFTLLSRGKIPVYVGSSFAYIGLTIYLIQIQTTEEVLPDQAYVYVGWAYLFSGLILVFLSFLYQKKGIDKILSFLLPASVVGPAISLIGLELADTAIVDSGFDVIEGMVDSDAALVAITTLVVIVLFSLIRHRVWKNAAIIAGMIVGYLVHILLHGFPELDPSAFRWLTVPRFHMPVFSVPENLFGLLVAVIPATFIVFTENIGRVTVVSRMTNEEKSETGLFNEKNIKSLQTGLFSHGVATVAAALMGSVPNTIYAENIAVMSIHKSDVKRNDPDPFIQSLINPFSPAPYIIAAFIAILFSFVGVLQSFLLSIPKAVIGGMELFLFGIISAPGIQLLVEQRVNYKKISNQIITAAVLISGISGLSVSLGVVELKGMGLGFVVGLVLNLLVQALCWLGNISDSISFEEVLDSCLSVFGKNTAFRVESPRLDHLADEDTAPLQNPHTLGKLLAANEGFPLKNGNQVSIDLIRSTVLSSAGIHFSVAEESDVIILRETANGIFLDVKSCFLPRDLIDKYLNDYKNSFDENSGYLNISVAREIPMRKIRNLLLCTVLQAEKNLLPAAKK
ncbi:MAG: hypothetical protein IKD31_05020 [Clostridia bacterium]|nr:hypothetical protein [Clostridia bacterium]